jgi:hypothetical protein
MGSNGKPHTADVYEESHLRAKPSNEAGGYALHDASRAVGMRAPTTTRSLRHPRPPSLRPSPGPALHPAASNVPQGSPRTAGARALSATASIAPAPLRAPEASAPSAASEASAPTPHHGTEAQALARYEPLVERGAWDQLAQELAAETRGPALTLLYAIARRETLDDRKQAAAMTQEALAAVAELLGVPQGSPIALLLGKRLLRKNPWHGKRKASAGLSVGLMIGGLCMGASIGWLVTKVFM